VGKCKKTADGRCKYRFPFTTRTHDAIVGKRWKMRRDKDSDARVVSHDPDLLRELPAHHCIEYCTEGTFLEYLLDYTIKGEPTFGLKPHS